MDQAFKDFFGQYFDARNDVPNPFDNEGFTQFIAEQIKNAMPNNQQQFPTNPQGDGRGSNSPVPNFNQGPRKKGPNFQGFDGGNQTRKQDVKYNLFETHDLVIARIAMNSMRSEPKKTLLINSHEIYLMEGKTEVVHLKLPKLVNPRHVKIVNQDAVLEIQMVKKEPEPLNEYEINDHFTEFDSSEDSESM